MNKDKYDQAVFRKLGSENFFELRNNPLPIKRDDQGLKTHKEGDEMSEIIADWNSPTYNIAKWLINECQALGTTNSVANCLR